MYLVLDFHFQYIARLVFYSDLCTDDVHEQSTYYEYVHGMYNIAVISHDVL